MLDKNVLCMTCYDDNCATAGSLHSMSSRIKSQTIVTIQSQSYLIKIIIFKGVKRVLFNLFLPEAMGEEPRSQS